MPIYPEVGDGGPNSGPGLNPLTIYVSPTGSDSNDGLTTSAAVHTGYAGYAKIVAAGGGILHLAEGSDWGGPVTNQGMWIRGDNATIPGWQAAVPCVITGEGASSVLFSNPGAAGVNAGAGLSDTYAYRKKPGIWISKAVTRITVKDIRLNDYLFNPIRLAMDYHRNSDGSIQNITVTHAARAGGFTVLDVTLPAGYPISNLSRTSNVVTATVPTPSANQTFPPWKAGQKVYINSTDVNFSSGQKTLLSVVANLDSSTNWGFTYAETAANATGTNPGNVQSHGCSDGEYLDLDSTDAKFPATQYTVASHTYNTITVLDPWGGELDNFGNAMPATDSANNIGTLVHQERVYCATLGTNLDNVTFTMPAGALYGLYYAGPGVDSGTQIAIGLQVSGGSQLQGVALGNGPGDVPFPRDDNRMAALLSSPGSPTNGVEPALIVQDSYSVDGGIRVVAGTNGCTVVVNNFIGEAASTLVQPPAVEVVGNFYSKVYIDYAIVADIDNSLPNVVVTNVPAQNCIVSRCGLVDLQTSFGAPPYPVTVARVIGVASGNITLGSVNANAIEFFDANQVSMGVVQLKDFTLNP